VLFFSFFSSSSSSGFGKDIELSWFIQRWFPVSWCSCGEVREGGGVGDGGGGKERSGRGRMSLTRRLELTFLFPFHFPSRSNLERLFEDGHRKLKPTVDILCFELSSYLQPRERADLFPLPSLSSPPSHLLTFRQPTPLRRRSLPSRKRPSLHHHLSPRRSSSHPILSPAHPSSPPLQPPSLLPPSPIPPRKTTLNLLPLPSTFLLLPFPKKILSQQILLHSTTAPRNVRLRREIQQS